MSHLENGDIGETGLLPVNQKLHRDWVGIFAGVMYLLVFMLMFWAKLKSLEAVLRSFLVVIFLVYMNAEFLLGHMRFYKTLRVFHKRLLVEYFGSAAVTLAFLVGGPVGTGALPCAITAGIYASAAIFFGAHLHPAVTLANYACHHNSLLPIHATSFVGVQMLGSTSAALIARLLHLPDATESFLTDMGHHLADVPWYDVMFVEIVYTAIIMGLVKLSNTQMATKFTTALALSLPPLLRIGYGAYSGIAGAPLDHSGTFFTSSIFFVFHD